MRWVWPTEQFGRTNFPFGRIVRGQNSAEPKKFGRTEKKNSAELKKNWAELEKNSAELKKYPYQISRPINFFKFSRVFKVFCLLNIFNYMYQKENLVQLKS